MSIGPCSEDLAGLRTAARCVSLVQPRLVTDEKMMTNDYIPFNLPLNTPSQLILSFLCASPMATKSSFPRTCPPPHTHTTTPSHPILSLSSLPSLSSLILSLSPVVQACGHGAEERVLGKRGRPGGSLHQLPLLQVLPRRALFFLFQQQQW